MPLIDRLRRDRGTTLHGHLRQLFIGRGRILQKAQDERLRQGSRRQLALPLNDAAGLGCAVGDVAEHLLQGCADSLYNLHGKLLLQDTVYR
jgi:hypothetical protein